MAVRTVVLDQEAILFVDGVLGGGLAPAYNAAVEEVFTQHPRSLVVDLSTATAVDGGGIAVVTATVARCRRLGARMVIAVPGRQLEINDPAHVRLLLQSVAHWRKTG